jgi:hypothetical protein
MTIIPLAHRPDLAAVVAQWHFDEWGNLYPGGTVNGWLDHIRTRMNADRIPMTIIAQDDRGEPIGTAARGSESRENENNKIELISWFSF